MPTLNWFTIVFVTLYFAEMAAAALLEYLNREHAERHAGDIPPGLEDFVERATAEKSLRYLAEKSRFNVLAAVSLDVAVLFFVVSGGLELLADTVRRSGLPFIPGGVLFFLVIGLVAYLVTLPFGYYFTFVLEEEFGFNRTDGKTWLADRLKELAVGGVFMALLLTAVLACIDSFGSRWWIYGFFATLAFELAAVWAYPVLIAPLFNKFAPLADKELSEHVKTLMQKCAIPIDGVFTMDASRRSTHSNAYFTGLGRTRRIVFHDTLLENHDRPELLAILAHEAGHYRRGHIVKGMALAALVAFAGFFVTGRLLERPELYAAFELPEGSLFAGLFVLYLLWRKGSFFIRPAGMAVSRRFEREADRFAAELTGDPSALRKALIRVYSGNLSNLHPHPYYVAFYYSHPPVAERARTLAAPDDKTDRTV